MENHISVYSFFSDCCEKRKRFARVDLPQKDKYGIDDLLQIMKLLRSPEGCPWDREQTHKSIRTNFLEETYEVLEAIDDENSALLKEELGDVLLQVVFHSQMSEEENSFDFSDVVTDICKKLIVRHPHIFSDVKAETTGQVLTNWENIKQQTKGIEKQSQSMDTVPRVLPALMRAEKVQKKASKAGLDWNTAEGIVDKLEGEINEFKNALEVEDSAGCAEEIGDILFTAVNISRFLKIDPEYALTCATDKFIKRFKMVERLAHEREVQLPSDNFALVDDLWEDAKKLT